MADYVRPQELSEHAESAGRRHRVLYILPQPFFACRGSAFRAQSTILALRDLGYEVDFLCLHMGDEIELENIALHRSYRVPGIRYIPVGPSWGKILCDVSLLAKATGLGVLKRYDIVHGVEEAGFIAGILGAARKIPFVFDMHSHMSEQLGDCGFIRARVALRGIERLENWTIRRAGAVITVGDTHRLRVQAIAPSVPVVSLPDLPLGDSTSTDPHAVERLRKEFALGEKRALVYTGNFHPYQGVDLLLHAFATLIQRVGDSLRTQLLLVGGDARDDQTQRYQALVRELGIAQHVTFTGQRPLREMGAFMALADILVSPRTEGANTPLKLYSYMAAGRPIVATRIESHTQVLTDNLAHLALPNAESFAAALSAALDESLDAQVLNREYVKRCKLIIEQRFNPSRFQTVLDSAYRRALGLPPKEPLLSVSGEMLRQASQNR